MNGVPLQKITVTGLILVALFLLSGVVLDLAGHDAEGGQAMATATGIAIGTGATTVVVTQQAAKDAKDNAEDPPKAA